MDEKHEKNAMEVPPFIKEALDAGIYKRCFSAARQAVMGRCADSEADAKDIYQEAWAKVLQNATKEKIRYLTCQYILGVVRNLCGNRIKKQGKIHQAPIEGNVEAEKMGIESIKDEEDIGADILAYDLNQKEGIRQKYNLETPPNQPLSQEDRAKLRGVLPEPGEERDWYLLTLDEYYELSYAEIADMIGSTVLYVGVLLTKARRKRLEIIKQLFNI